MFDTGDIFLKLKVKTKSYEYKCWKKRDYKFNEITLWWKIAFITEKDMLLLNMFNSGNTLLAVGENKNLRGNKVEKWKYIMYICWYHIYYG